MEVEEGMKELAAAVSGREEDDMEEAAEEEGVRTTEDTPEEGPAAAEAAALLSPSVFFLADFGGIFSRFSALAAALMVLPFPETAQKPLPNTKEEVRRLGVGEEMEELDPNMNGLA